MDDARDGLLGEGSAALSGARYGSDVVVELLARAGVEHAAFNPGASFRGIHDSLVHAKRAPGIVLVPHEAISVAVAHGYAKATGRPMAALLHDVVGLQNAAMAIFNAWCDRVPVLLLGGTGPMSKAKRRPWIDWIHTALVQGQQVRDYVKWDDQPWDLESVPESFARGLTTALSAPAGPVYLCYDVELQEQEVEGALPLDALDAYEVPRPPAPSAGEAVWIAERCATARQPVIVTDYAGDTPEGFAALRRLAEALCAPVIDGGARLSFPTDHPLCFSDERTILEQADFVLALDVEDLDVTQRGHLFPGGEPLVGRRPGTIVVHCTPGHLKLRSWANDYHRLLPVDRVVTATAETAADAVLDAYRRAPTAPAAIEAREQAVVGHRGRLRRQWWAEASAAEPVDGALPPARVAAELWELIRDEPWTLVHGSLEGWERRLWDFTEPRQHLGWHGGGGLGYGLGASIGAGLALGRERLCIDLQPDGDLLYTTSALWTAARCRVAVLIVVHNNRQYGNSVGHAEHMAQARGRGVEDRYAGTSLDDPPIDFAGLALGHGVWGAGPVADVEALRRTLGEAIGVVRRGLPALVDVVTTGA